MKMNDIKNMTQDEVQRELEELKESFANMRFQKATHQLDNPVKLRYMRKDIARLKTILKEFDSGLRGTGNKQEEKS